MDYLVAKAILLILSTISLESGLLENIRPHAQPSTTFWRTLIICNQVLVMNLLEILISYLVSLAEQELLYFTGAHEFTPGFSGVRAPRFSVFYFVLCRLLFVVLSFLFSHCILLTFFKLRLLITIFGIFNVLLKTNRSMKRPELPTFWNVSFLLIQIFYGTVYNSKLWAL